MLTSIDWLRIVHTLAVGLDWLELLFESQVMLGLESSKLIESEEYQSFRSSVPLRKIAVDEDNSKVLILNP